MKNLLIILFTSILAIGCKPQTQTEKLVDVIVDNIKQHPSKWSKGESMAMVLGNSTYEVIKNSDCSISISITSIGQAISMSIYSHEHGITVSTSELDDINKVIDAFNNRPKKEVQTLPDKTPKNADILISELKNCYK